MDCITEEQINNLSRLTGASAEDVLRLIGALNQSFALDIVALGLAARGAGLGIGKLNRSLINVGTEPFYQRAARTGGKKRKQRYHNKQRR